MFPIFGVACLAHELAAGRAYEVALWRILLRQALHWIGPIAAVKILFMQHARGQMSTDAVALTIILLLAVTCFLAGVHFDRSFFWVSAFLAVAAAIGAGDRNLSLVRRGAVADWNRDRGALGDSCWRRGPKARTAPALSASGIRPQLSDLASRAVTASSAAVALCTKYAVTFPTVSPWTMIEKMTVA